MSNTDGKPRPATFQLNPEQIAWVEREAKRLEVETGGIVVSRSAVVRRALDEVRKKRQGEGQ